MHSLDAGATVVGTGELHIPSGNTLNVNTSFTGANALMGTLDIDGVFNQNAALEVGGVLQLSGMLNSVTNTTILSGGSFSWGHGTLAGTGLFTTAAGSTSTIPDNDGTRTVQDRVWDNYGAVHWDAVYRLNNLALDGTAVFNNRPGGTFTLNRVDGRDPSDLIGTGGVFNNEGTFIKIGDTTAVINVPFTNTGTVDVNNGWVNFNADSSSAGVYDVDAGTGIRFGGGAVHSLDAGATVLGTGTLRVPSGESLSLNNIASIASKLEIFGTMDALGTETIDGVLYLSGGILTGAGDITANGAFDWLSGTVAGTGALVTNGATTLAGNSAFSLDTRTWDNFGIANWQASAFTLANGAVVNNRSGATFVKSGSGYLNGTGTFNNAGTFQKTGSSVDQVNVPFNNSGTLAVDAGRLELLNGSTSSGEYTMLSNGILQMGTGTHTITGTGASITGVGAFSLSSGAAVTIDDTLAAPITSGLMVVNGSSLTINGDNVIDGGIMVIGGAVEGSGDVTVDGTFIWTGGTLSGSGGWVTRGTTTIGSNGGTKTLTDRMWDNFGTVDWDAAVSGENLELAGTAVFNNQTGGVLHIDQTHSNAQFTGAGVVNNAGTIWKTGGSSSNISLPFDQLSTGLLDIDEGRVSLNGGSTVLGTIDLAYGAKLMFGAGAHDINPGVVFVGQHGTVNIGFGTTNINTPIDYLGHMSTWGGTLNLLEDLSVAGDFTMNLPSSLVQGGGDLTVGGTFTWNDGTFSGSGIITTSGASELVSNGITKTITDRTWNNAGAATWQAGAAGDHFQLDGESSLNNLPGGTFTVNQVHDDADLLGPGTIVNEGTFAKIGAASTDVLTGFTNAGTVTVSEGNVAFSCCYEQTAGLTALAGGTITGDLYIYGGMLTGSGSVMGSIDNAGGTVSPGESPGTLNISGDYTQGSEGTLFMEVGGHGGTPGVDYDVLNVSGTATLVGTLSVGQFDGFVSNYGDTFDFITYGGVSGNFATVSADSGYAYSGSPGPSVFTSVTTLSPAGGGPGSDGGGDTSNPSTDSVLTLQEQAVDTLDTANQAKSSVTDPGDGAEEDDDERKKGRLICR